MSPVSAPMRARRAQPPSRTTPDTAKKKPAPAEAVILGQSYFKSVGPRTYAAQLKRAGNGNHFLVLTEGKRDDKTGEVRKTRLFVFSEDFDSFFKLIREAEQLVRAHPVPAEVRQKRARFWNGRAAKSAQKTRPTSNAQPATSN